MKITYKALENELYALLHVKGYNRIQHVNVFDNSDGDTLEMSGILGSNYDPLDLIIDTCEHHEYEYDVQFDELKVLKNIYGKQVIGYHCLEDCIEIEKEVLS